MHALYFPENGGVPVVYDPLGAKARGKADPTGEGLVGPSHASSIPPASMGGVLDTTTGSGFGRHYR